MFSLSLTQPQIAMVLLQTGNNGRMGVSSVSQLVNPFKFSQHIP